MKKEVSSGRRKKQRNKLIAIIVGILYVVATVVACATNGLMNTYKRLSLDEAIEQATTLKGLSFVTKVSGTFLLYYLMISVLVAVIAYIKKTEAERRRVDDPDTSKGDAHWMTLAEYEEYAKVFTAPFGEVSVDGKENMILSQEMRLAINNKKTRRNCNILVYGGSGAGKSRFFATPNILQYNSNFVVTDPKGELFDQYAKGLENQGYNILVFNTSEMALSSHYNPFHYIKSEADIFTMANTIVANTQDPNRKGGDAYWDDMFKMLLTCCIAYLWHTIPEGQTINGLDRSLQSVLKLVAEADINENDEEGSSALDDRFAELKKMDPDNLACRTYDKFKKGSGKSLKSVLSTVASRLQIFELSNVQELTSKDDFDFDTFGDSKNALFVIIPAADDTFNALVSMLYTQMFSCMYAYVERRAEFGWQIKMADGEFVKVFQSTGKQQEESLLAKKKAEKFMQTLQRGTYITCDKHRALYNLYTTSSYERVKAFTDKADVKNYIKLFKEGSRSIDSRIVVEIEDLRLESAIKRAEEQNSAPPSDGSVIWNIYKVRNYQSYGQEITEKVLLAKRYSQEESDKYVQKVFDNLKISTNKNKTEYYVDITNREELVAWRGSLADLQKYQENLATIQLSQCERRVPIHVRFILDEFANIGQIPQFDKKLSTMRSYELSCAIILQAISQLKEQYKESYNTIIGNCDTTLFLGCNDEDTIKAIVTKLGDKTIRTRSESENSNKSGSVSMGHDKLALASFTQLEQMPDDECVVIIRGNVQPYWGKKYNVERHPNYQYAMKYKNKYVYPFAANKKAADVRPFFERAAEQDKGANSVAPTPQRLAKQAEEQQSSTAKINQLQNKHEDDGAMNPQAEAMLAEAISASMGISNHMTPKDINEQVESFIDLQELTSSRITYYAS